MKKSTQKNDIVIDKNRMHLRKGLFLTEQLLEKGNALGAHLKEVKGVQTKEELTTKMILALQVADETMHALRRLAKTNYLGEKRCDLLTKGLASLTEWMQAIANHRE